MTKVLLAVAITFLSGGAHAAVDLALARLAPIGGNDCVSPGAEVTFRYSYNYSAAVEAQVIQTLTCARRLEGVDDSTTLDLIVKTSDDPAGLIFTGKARIESDEPDPTPYNNETPISLTVDHLLTVTTPDDFGAGSLRDSIEHANAECSGSLPCKMIFAQSMRIVTSSPLPAITACGLRIDAGEYLDTPGNVDFDKPDRVEISGERAGSGNGLGGEVHLSGNAIGYNRDFGIAVGPHAAHVASEDNYIIANGGPAIDWGLDGPSDLPALPPVPHLTEAFLDAATRKTILRGVLPISALTRPGFYAIRLVLSARDFDGGAGAKPGDIPFELVLKEDFTGRRIGAQSIHTIYPDVANDDSSEYGATIVVR